MKLGSTAGSSSLVHPTSKRKSDDKPEIANNVPDYSDVLDDSKSVSNFKKKFGYLYFWYYHGWFYVIAMLCKTSIAYIHPVYSAGV